MEISIQELEKRMRPGEFSHVGFLGWEESLVDVLQEDKATLQLLGLTSEELARPLEIILQFSLSGKMPKDLRNRFKVKTEMFTGFQICPFSPDPDHEQCSQAGGVQFGSINWAICNRRTGQQLKGSGLITHLIRAHHFFEGKHSPYRINPEDLAKLLELGPYR